MIGRAIVVTLILLASSGRGDNSFVELAGEAGLALPSGWRVIGSTESYPFAIAHDESEAQLLLFQSEMTGADRFTGPPDFEVAVQQVIDSVVMTLPEAQILTNTGYHENGRAEFVIEFQTQDTALGRAMQHRLMGVVYRHETGHQLLFSLWGRAPREAFATIGKDFETIQNSFRYTGPQAEEVFVSPSDNLRWMIVLVAGLGAVLFFLRQRRRQLQRDVSSAPPTWRCTCGRTNHADNETCRSCGRSRDESD